MGNCTIVQGISKGGGWGLLQGELGVDGSDGGTFKDSAAAFYST